MSGISVAQHAPAQELTAARDGLRRASLGTSVGLLIQYGLGMWVNLYVSVPARDHGGGAAAAIGRSLANGPAALAVHAGIGLLLIVSAVALVVRAIRARHRAIIVTSLIGLAAIAGAAASGAAFVNAGHDGASLGMALLTGVALLCSVLSLYILGSDRGSA
jgi:hypothetical protein